MSCTIRRFDDATGFLERAEDFLLRAEAENNLLLGIARLLQEAPRVDAYLATVERDGRVIGAAVRTPPRKLVLAELPEDAIEPLVDDVRRAFPDLPEVLGPDEVAERFARVWVRPTGGTPRRGMRQRIHRLDRVADLPPAPGRLREATPDDEEILARWVVAFAEDAAVEAPDDPGAWTRDRVGRARLHVWDDDAPVSFAGWRPVGPNCSCVAPVYTPRELRGRGYATACVAALSRLRLERGDRFVVLFTDLANPTSNRIYRRIGYRPVIDVTDWKLGSPDPEPRAAPRLVPPPGLR